MSALWIDAPTGLAGDMLLAALLDLGVDQAVVESPLAALGLAGRYRITQHEERSGGLRGVRVDVRGLEDQPPHRHWSGIRDQINAAALAPTLKQRVLAVFTRLAEAEASVHGTSVEAVHFHEVGAIDALVDVVGVCAAMDDLNPAEVVCSPLPAGTGTVATAHGLLPVPVPAVLELARRHRIPLLQGEGLPTGELVTPTGLALVSVLVDRFMAPEVLVAEKIGVGLGHRQLDRPNLVRLVLHTPQLDAVDAPRWESLIVQEAWIDDATPEEVAALANRLRDAGAIDVAVQPLLMKKGRSGQAVTALVRDGNAEQMRSLWLSAGSSIGLRERRQGRWVLPRRQGVLETPWGPLAAKQVRRPDGRCTVKAEAEALAALQASTGCGLDELRAAAAAAPFVSTEDWA
ncbi:MAG: nickel pincer cofactor biosynthesis protein LarC [Synechococcus sp. BS301-5m-G53]|nr:nickel pincer cofactor biosynthesis protein LarC [Synechococcus sp. BS301-5m-G53]